MPIVLICSPSAADADLAHTLLWRHDVERHQASGYEQALSLAVAASPDLTLIDRELPRALELMRALRNDAKTRRTSLVVMAKGDFDPSEVELLEAGANAILRLPAQAEWDERLDRLLNIPARREARFDVAFTVEATFDGETASGIALNLSAHGLLLETKAGLKAGDWLAFRFPLPRATVSGRGRVVRLAGAGRFGVYFESVEADGRAHVEAYIASLGGR
jgi:CheY-like chemotaxis protein